MSDARPQSIREHSDLTRVKVMICSDNECDKNGRAFPARASVGDSHWIFSSEGNMAHTGSVASLRVEVELPRYGNVVLALADALASAKDVNTSTLINAIHVWEWGSTVCTAFVGEDLVGSTDIMWHLQLDGYLVNFIGEISSEIYCYEIVGRVVDTESLRNLGGCNV